MRPTLRHTYTFAELAVSPATFEEIKHKLKEAGYRHAFIDELIDMHGIALVREVPEGEGEQHR